MVGVDGAVTVIVYEKLPELLNGPTIICVGDMVVAVLVLVIVTVQPEVIPLMYTYMYDAPGLPNEE